MPKNPNYAHCVFYRLVCRDVSVTECYVGHTCDEVKRRSKHKTACHNEKGKAYKFFVYRFIRDHGGFDNWMLLVHEKLAVKDDVEARLRERFWTEHYQSTLNSNVPGQTPAEYHANHREERNKRSAAYHVDHREERNKRSAAYHVDHREERNKRSAAYKLAHETQLKEKHTCLCGGKYTTNNLASHLKSKKHIAFVAN